MKTSFSPVIAITLCSLLPACGGDGGRDFKAAIVVTAGGLGDNGFNDLAQAGLTTASEEYGIDTATYETAPEAAAAILSRAVSEGSDLTLAIGTDISQGLAMAAPAWPNAYFAAVDTVAAGDNVASLLFSAEQGSFLAGALAALMTEHGTVGFLGGQNIPPIWTFEAGFRAGVAAINPQIQIVSVYAGSFFDAELGKKIAEEQYAQGADIIFHAAGTTGNGVFAAARGNPSRRVIGVDVDQSGLAPENTLASAIKRIDVAVEDIIGKTFLGKFRPGTKTYDLKSGAVDLVYGQVAIPDGVRARIESLRTQIIAGEIIIPVDRR